LPFSNSNTCYGICTTSIGLSHADSIQTRLRDGSDYFKPDRLNTNYFNTIGAIPIQLTEREARSLLPLVEGERDRAMVLRIVESFLPAVMEGAA